MNQEKISHYGLLEVLKKGHFCATYKAVDNKTDQKVIVKIFSQAALADRSRFDRVRDAVLKASSLNHPHLASVYEFSSEDGTEFMVSEYVQGESLEAMFRRKRLRRKETISFAQQILSAMEALEGGGMAHGTLHPSNVLIATDGRLKVTDAGFAYFLEGFRYSATSQPVGATPDSLAYLAPEQVTEHIIDNLADIFAYGAILYQMSAGRPAFKRDWTVATLDAILKETPQPPESASSHAPKGSDRVVMKCLQHEPERRFQSFSEVRPMLEKLRIDHVSTSTSRRSFKVENWERLLRWTFASMVTVAAIVAVVMWWRSRASDTAAGTDLTAITAVGGLDSDPAISPSGEMVVYASDRSGEGNLDIWVQPTAEKKATRLTSHSADDHEPAFSPDGKLVAFRSEREDGGVYVMPVSGGGPERLVAKGGRRPRFSPDGSSIAYWTGPAGLSPDIVGDYQVHVVSASGGPSRRLQAEFAAARYPVWAPDGKHLLVIGKMTPAVDRGFSDWWLFPVDGSAAIRTGACEEMQRMQILAPAQCSIPGDWRDSHVIFSVPEGTGAHLYRLKLSAQNPRIVERPTRATRGDRLEVQPYLSADGSFVFTSQVLSIGVWSIAINADEGRSIGEPQQTLKSGAQDSYPTMSDNGKRMVFLSNRSGVLTPWMQDLDNGKDTIVTDGRQEQLWPRVSPDGTKVAFSESRIGRYEQFVAPLGEGSTQLICQDCGGAIVYDWSNDSKRVLIDHQPSGANFRGIAEITVAGGNRVDLLRDPEHPLTQGQYSPDEKRIAMVVREDSGRSRIVVAPNRAGSSPSEWIPITDGRFWDTSPQWSPNGRIVYYVSNRDANRCVWAQKLDPSSRPEGVPFVVYHFHSARRSPALTAFNGLDLFISGNKLLISLGDVTGNIYRGVPD